MTWADLKHQAIQAFNGELPNATTEQEIIDAFQLEPIAVLHALDQVTQDFQQGKLRSGWAIWRKRCQAAATIANIEVNTSDRPRAIASAEAFIHHAGGYLDSEAELIGHLFGPAELTPPLAFLENLDTETKQAPGRHLYDSLLAASLTKTRDEGPQEIPATIGLLSAHDTPELRQRMIVLWTRERPKFVAAEAASLERQHAQAETLKRLRKASATTSLDIDPDQHAALVAGVVNRALDPHYDDWIDRLAQTHDEMEAA